MERDRGQGSPDQKPKTQRNTHSKEQGSVHKESGGGTLRLSHEQLVRGFQDYVRQLERQFGGYWSPAEIIRSKLKLKGISDNRIERDFWAPIRYAWDALAYDHYEPGAPSEHLAGHALSRYHQAKHELTIKLSHPVQIRVIDALAEAAGIPHERGQAEIEIPEKLKNYYKYRLSNEYQERVAKAKEEHDEHTHIEGEVYRHPTDKILSK